MFLHLFALLYCGGKRGDVFRKIELIAKLNQSTQHGLEGLIDVVKSVRRWKSKNYGAC